MGYLIFARGLFCILKFQSHEVRFYLEQLCGIPLVKGVRRLIQSEDIEFCLSPDFLQGLQLLPEFDLSFDICIYRNALYPTPKRMWDIRRVIGGTEMTKLSSLLIFNVALNRFTADISSRRAKKAPSPHTWKLF